MVIAKALTPLEILYKGLLRLHQKYQLAGGRKDSPVPSIGVGNLRIGGTGKTPLSILLAERLVTKYKTGIIHSGYKRKSKGYLYVEPNKEIKVESVGDEPFLIYQKLSKRVFLLVDRNRLRALEYATNIGIEAVVLDDNFQYLRLKAHVQIVILLPDDLESRLLPIGRLREPVESLKRADIILINLKHHDSARLSQSWNKPTFHMKYKINGFKDVANNKYITLHDISSEPVMVFCGIADPDSFLESLKRADLNVVYFKKHLDHFWFRERHINALLRLKEKLRAKYIITTEKDLVRLPFVPEGTLVPELTIQIENEDKFFELLREFSGLEFKEGSNR